MLELGSQQPERRTQAQRSHRTRAKILSGTIRAIRTHGYANSTIARIAKTARVSIGAIQYHFNDKDDLMVAMLDHVFEDLHRFLTGPEARSGNLTERVRIIVDRYWHGFASPNYLVAWEIIAAAKDHPLLRTRIREHSANATQSAFGLWRDAFSDLGISDENLFATLQMTLASLRGLAVLRWVDEDPTEHGNYKAMMAQTLETQLMRDAVAGQEVPWGTDADIGERK
jgi:AcrR family transcriptional regulator